MTSTDNSSSVMEQKLRFDKKIQELRAGQGKNVRMFSNIEYGKFIQEVKDIRTPGHRMMPSDFYMMKRFEVMQVEKNGENIKKW